MHQILDIQEETNIKTLDTNPPVCLQDNFFIVCIDFYFSLKSFFFFNASNKNDNTIFVNKKYSKMKFCSQTNMVF